MLWASSPYIRLWTSACGSPDSLLRALPRTRSGQIYLPRSSSMRAEVRSRNVNLRHRQTGMTRGQPSGENCRLRPCRHPLRESTRQKAWDVGAQIVVDVKRIEGRVKGAPRGRAQRCSSSSARGKSRTHRRYQRAASVRRRRIRPIPDNLRRLPPSHAPIELPAFELAGQRDWWSVSGSTWLR
jgi:hypothetical protein